MVISKGQSTTSTTFPKADEEFHQKILVWFECEGLGNRLDSWLVGTTVETICSVRRYLITHCKNLYMATISQNRQEKIC